MHKNLQYSLFGFFFYCFFDASASLYQVGALRPYATPNVLYLANVLNDNDTIEIDADVYSGVSALAVWTKNNLHIRGSGGRPHLFANGQYIMGKGIWVCSGNNITVENIEFSGASVPDQNGAGIRLDGTGLRVRHCYFHDNENGILTSNPYAGDILIEYSEFERNGFGDGYSHNLYIGHVNSLTFRFNYSHHAKVGHNLKSRADTNIILYNRIMDEETGNSSRLIDLPNGGFSIIMGNLLMQGELAVNNNLIGYGLEGLSNSPPYEVNIINNTLVNKRVASCLFISLANSTTTANISNNIFAGTGIILNGTATSMSNNYTTTNIPDVHFTDEVNFDYHLSADSPAIDYGITISPAGGYSLTPDSTYEHPCSYGLRYIVNNAIDAGAYESGVINSTETILPDEIIVFPTPANRVLFVDCLSDQISLLRIFSIKGEKVKEKAGSGIIDFSGIPAGSYIVCIELRNGKRFTRRILKN